MVIKTKDGKESTLLDIYNYAHSAKIMEKFLYFGVFLLVYFLILLRSGNFNLIGIDVVLQIAYVFVFLFLFLGLGIYGSRISTKSEKQTIIRYLLSRSLQNTNTDFIEGWILFVIYSFILISRNYVFLSNYGLVLGMCTVVLSVFFIFLPVAFRFLNKYEYQVVDLESIIFKDGLNKVRIKLYIGSGTKIEGEIKDIKDELTVCTNESSETGTLYVPWENILGFEIVEEIVH